ncbi:MAG: hypothetical protein J6I49_05065 [Bacteroidales bacterium]|nr:hypothetical protein [Bacteroidales bacterium]
MKRIVLILLLVAPSLVWGYDFAAVVPSGQTLYFDIVEGGVKVVYPYTSASPWGSYQKPTGALTIPATVVHEGTTYAVLSLGTKSLYATYITSLTLEEGVQSLATNACGFNEYLTTVQLPASLSTLGSSSFMLCSALTDVHMMGSQPPASSAAGAFTQSSVGTAALHVPCGSISAYAGAPWNLFGSIDDGVCSVTITTASTDPLRGTVSGGGTYATGTSVVLTATPAAGFGFACWTDGDTLNPRVVGAVRDSHFVAVFQRPIHDTVVISTVELQVDTVYLPDTLYLRDTLEVQPTFYRLQVQSCTSGGGVGIGGATVPAGTELEIGALPLEGHRFSGWDDGGAENPRRVTVVAEATYTACFEPLLAAPSTAAPDWSLSLHGRTLEVRCRAGEPVKIYDGSGRILSSLAAHADTTTVELPSAGVYIVQVGTGAGRKVTVR